MGNMLVIKSVIGKSEVDDGQEYPVITLWEELRMAKKW